MSINEFKDSNAKMDEIQKGLDADRENHQKEFDEVMAEVMKAIIAQQEEDPVMKTLNDVFERVETFRNKRMNVNIKTSEIKALEAVNPEFVAATQTGFSEEEVKRYIITAFDALFEALNIGKLENTLSNVMLSVMLQKKIDFSKFSGIGVYNYVRERKEFAKLLEPEYKKKIIYSEAVKIVLEAKTISFNTAVKRAIREIEEYGFVPKMDAEDQELLDDISGIVNPLIDLYIDNEMSILAAITSKIK